MEESLKLALSSVLFETTDFFYLKRFAIAELSRKKKKRLCLNIWHSLNGKINIKTKKIKS